MKLIQRLKARFRPAPVEPILTPINDAELAQLAKDVQLPPPPPTPKQPRGHVIKRAKRPEYSPSSSRKGGRIVKAMPRQLQRIKEEQEKVEDD